MKYDASLSRSSPQLTLLFPILIFWPLLHLVYVSVCGTVTALNSLAITYSNVWKCIQSGDA